MTAVDLTPLRLAVRPRRRFGQLLAGLALYGTSMTMMIRSSLGLNPWDVLHEGVTLRTGWSFGTVTALTGLVVLLAWIPLRQRPGIGTVANIVVIAVSVDAVLALLPASDTPAARLALLVGGVVGNGLATAIELSVLALGWLLGGTVGLGTVLYALAIGPLTQLFLPWVTVRQTRYHRLPHGAM